MSHSEESRNAQNVTNMPRQDEPRSRGLDGTPNKCLQMEDGQYHVVPSGFPHSIIRRFHEVPGIPNPFGKREQVAEPTFSDRLKAVLVAHPLMAITCDHEAGTDTPQCGCCSLQFPAYNSVGEAVDAWANHVVNQLPILQVEKVSGSMDDLQAEVGQWGAETFPQATIASIHIKMFKEARELVQALGEWQERQMPVKPDVVWPTVMEEIADVILLAMQIAHRKGFSLEDVIKHKLSINKTRQWRGPDSTGVYEHKK